MRTEQEKEILKAIKEDNIINYIDNNYWQLTEDVKDDLLKEILYLLPDYKYIELYDNLKEYRDFQEYTKEESENNEEN